MDSPSLVPLPQAGGMAGIINPQQSQVPPEIQQAMRPPVDAAEYQQRVSLWQQFQDKLRGDPNLQSALLRFGTQMMQPVPAGQSKAGHIGRAVDQGANFYQAGVQNTADEGRRQEETRLKRDELGVRAEEAKSRISLQGAQTAATRSQTSIAEREAPAKLRQIEAQIRGTDASAHYHGALTELNKIKSELERAYGPAEAEAKLRGMNADVIYREALAGYHNAHKLQVDQLVAQGKGWQSTGMRIDETTGTAISEATNKTTGERQRVVTYNPVPLAESSARAKADVSAVLKATSSSWFGTSQEQIQALSRAVGQPVKDEKEAVRVLTERYNQGQTIVTTISPEGAVTTRRNDASATVRGTAPTAAAARRTAEEADRRGQQVSVTVQPNVTSTQPIPTSSVVSGASPPPATTTPTAPVPVQRLQSLGWSPGVPGRAVVDGQTYDVDARGNTTPVTAAAQPPVTAATPATGAPASRVPQLVTTSTTRTSPKERSAQARASYAQAAGEQKTQAILSAFRDVVQAGKFTPDEAGLIRDAIATGKLLAAERQIAEQMLSQLRR